MKGGKFLASGTYGCAFAPQLPCKVSGKIPKNAVGKIFDDANAFKEEVRFNRLILKIDPTGYFTPRFYGTCVVNFAKVSEADESYKCDLYSQAIPKQTIMENGGVPLKTAVSKHGIMIDTLIVAFYPLFVGLSMLLKRKVAHSDIKPSNMLYNITTRRAVLIDFGLMTKITDIVKNDHGILTHTYLYYPPELKIYARLLQVKKGIFGVQALYESIMENYDTLSMQSLEKLFPGYSDSIYKTLRDALAQDYTVYASAFSKEYVRVLDIYSLGMSFVECFFIIGGPDQIGDEGFVREFLQEIIRPTIEPDAAKRIRITELVPKFREFLIKHNRTFVEPPGTPLSAATLRGTTPKATSPKRLTKEEFALCKLPPGKGGYTAQQVKDVAKRFNIVATKRPDIVEELKKFVAP